MSSGFPVSVVYIIAFAVARPETQIPLLQLQQRCKAASGDAPPTVHTTCPPSQRGDDNLDADPLLGSLLSQPGWEADLCRGRL
jgi:hypothetical protein